MSEAELKAELIRLRKRQQDVADSGISDYIRKRIAQLEAELKALQEKQG